MPGLRDKQKAERTRRIIEAANDLFREQGFEQTRIEAIADRAEVSVGTLYNYYQNKGDILVAIVAIEVADVLAAGEHVLKDPPSDPTDALNLLVTEYYDHSLHYLSKPLWRAAMAIAIQHPENPFSQRYAEMGVELQAQVTALIEILQRRGTVKPEVHAKALGAVFFNNLDLMFAAFCRQDPLSLEELKARVFAQQAPIAALIKRCPALRDGGDSHFGR